MHPDRVKIDFSGVISSGILSRWLHANFVMGMVSQSNVKCLVGGGILKLKTRTRLENIGEVFEIR